MFTSQQFTCESILSASLWLCLSYTLLILYSILQFGIISLFFRTNVHYRRVMKMTHLPMIYGFILFVYGKSVVLWGELNETGIKADQLESVITIYTNACAFIAKTENSGLVT